MKMKRLNASRWVGIWLTVLASCAAAQTPPASIGMVGRWTSSPTDRRCTQRVWQQSGIQVLFYSDVANGRSAPALAGTFTPDEALTKLLSNTGLTIHISIRARWRFIVM